MKSIPLAASNGEVWAHLCRRCRKVHSGSSLYKKVGRRRPDKDRLRLALEDAERCCTCTKCGKAVRKDSDMLCVRCNVTFEKESKVRHRKFKKSDALYVEEHSRRRALSKDKDIADLLRALMSDLSEAMWCAGWSSDLEFTLWGMLLEGGKGTSPCRSFEDRLSKPEAVKLRSLSRRAGGWWMHWEAPGGAGGPVFVPMAEWRKVYASYKRGEVLKTSAKD